MVSDKMFGVLWVGSLILIITCEIWGWFDVLLGVAGCLLVWVLILANEANSGWKHAAELDLQRIRGGDAARQLREEEIAAVVAIISEHPGAVAQYKAFLAGRLSLLIPEEKRRQSDLRWPSLV